MQPLRPSGTVKIAQAIREARKRRLGADDEPTRIPTEVYAGCRTWADHIRRARQFLLEREATDPKRAIVGVEATE